MRLVYHGYSPTVRTHVVMVPGFGGFDALGQLRYYCGCTHAFGKRPEAALHYFETLPAGSVHTRARRLSRFLANLSDRGVIQPRDEVALVGHSTGGLDIRQLVRDLAHDDTHVLLPRIRRAVFMSVPHYGTNSASWVRGVGLYRKVLVAIFRRAVGLHVTVPMWPFERLFSLVVPGRAQLFDAIEDARRDMIPRGTDALADADAREAAAEIDLWLANTDHDFLAIDDLEAARPEGTRLVDTAEVDRQLWQRLGIAAQSYATLGRCPFDAAKLRRHAGKAHSIFEIVVAARRDVRDTDAFYRIAYLACAGGPFDVAPNAAAIPWLPALRGVFGWSWREPHAPERWQNDGIVNTGSMRSPVGGETFLVPGDHADIMGHFMLRERDGDTRPKNMREHDAYDLLGSDQAGRFAPIYKAVWDHAFDFVVPA